MEEAVGEVVSGMSRALAYGKYPENFVYDVPLVDIKSLDLQDVRVLIEGE